MALGPAGFKARRLLCRGDTLFEVAAALGLWRVARRASSRPAPASTPARNRDGSCCDAAAHRSAARLALARLARSAYSASGDCAAAMRHGTAAEMYE